MIDTGGEWWKGSDHKDIAEFLREYQAEGYPPEHVTDSVCATCGGRSFLLEVNSASEDGARRTCVACDQSVFIADSEEYWEEDEVEQIACACGAETFEIAVGFALTSDKQDVKWISVGVRCVADGILGSPVDWKINYGPSLHLLEQA